MRVTGVKGGKEETAGEGGGKEDRGMGDKKKTSAELIHPQQPDPAKMLQNSRKK